VEFRGERNVVPNYIISTMTTRRLIRRWWHAYLTYVVDFKKKSKELVDIPIVK
jgi:predicted metal-binding protein